MEAGATVKQDVKQDGEVREGVQACKLLLCLSPYFSM